MKSIMFLVAMTMTSLSFAGEKGHGGGIHLCSGDKAPELYDIYEGFSRYNIVNKDDGSSVESQLKRAMIRITNRNPELGFKIAKQLEYLKTHMLMRAQAKLTLIPDADVLMVDEGCEYKQLANWDEFSGNIIVREDYFNKLDNLNKAAFYLHEAYYKVYRDSLPEAEKDKRVTSNTVRRNVADAFSLDELQFIQKGMLTVNTVDRPFSFTTTLTHSERKGERIPAKYTFNVDLHSADDNFYDYEVRWKLNLPKYKNEYEGHIFEELVPAYEPIVRDLRLINFGRLPWKSFNELHNNGGDLEFMIEVVKNGKIIGTKRLIVPMKFTSSSDYETLFEIKLSGSQNKRQ